MAIYLNGGGDLSVPLSKVEGTNGKIILRKNYNRPKWFHGHFSLTEADKLALHSIK
jgi:hypothetical protein